MVDTIIALFLLALIAAMFGFTGLSGTFATVAQCLAGLFTVLFLAGLTYNLLTRKA